MWISPRRESVQQLLMAAGPAHGVAVHAPHDVLGKFRLDLALQLLGAEPLIANLAQAALRTLLLGHVLEAAVMAEVDVPFAMIGQGQVAELALLDVAARRAVDDRSKSRGD